MAKFTKKEILNLVEEEDVEFIRLQFTDMFGNLKNTAVTVGQLEYVIDHKYMFDKAAVDGGLKGGEEDLYLQPDLDTFTILPWRPQQGKVARLLCDVCRADGTLYQDSSRTILKQVLAEAKKKGLTLYADPECEFFLFHTDENGIPTTVTHEQAGYMDISPLDLGENARRDMVLMLEDMGFEIESSHHEMAPAQHEIDFKYAEALETADHIMTFKSAVRSIAKRHGLHVTFMPKPKAGVPGSGMHMHISVHKDGRNLFADARDQNALSQEALWFIGGIMAHAGGIAAISNPLVNSYKRLSDGFAAPGEIVWSTRNLNTYIRALVGNGESARVELRFPDPSANPYLLLAVCVAAGLEGIKKQILPDAEVRRSVTDMSGEEKAAAGIKSLPENLQEAVEALERDAFLEQVLGKSFVEKYCAAKKKEWQRYVTQVTDWEVREYLYRT